jgi:tetratricopeptide (TPR) repeat protein
MVASESREAALSEFRYKAFISYSHQDEAVARWLHRALETYRPPRGALPDHRADRKYPLSPIFRDREELVASSSLSDSIRKAIADSEFLVVVCTPAARESHWVEQEILEFKRQHPSDRVIAVIPPRTSQHCFPDALEREVLPSGEYGPHTAEPLAADLRGDRGARRLGFLKLAAAMLQVDLDRLLKREVRRRHRFLRVVTAASVTGMVVLGWLTFTAVSERRAADESRVAAEQALRLADQRRQESEELVEFMLGDLRDRLEPVGRLDVLDAVGAKALDYYAAQDQDRLGPDSLGRRARALHLLGEIQDLKGDSEAALALFRQAAESTGKLLQSEPRNQQRIFDHAQSQFWVGMVALQRGDYPDARQAFHRYLQLAQRLVALDAENPDWRLEVFYAYQALGGLAMEREAWEQAQGHFRDAFDELGRLDSTGDKYLYEFASLHSWLSYVYGMQKKFRLSQIHNGHEIGVWERKLDLDSQDYVALRQLVVARRGAAQLALIEGNTEGALEALVKIADIADRLISHEAENTLNLQQRVHVTMDLAEVHLLRGDTVQASHSVRTCLSQVSGLVDLDPTNVIWRVELDWQCRYLDARLAQMDQDAARAQLQLSSYYDELLSHYHNGSDNKDLILLWGNTNLLLGNIVYTQGRPASAQDYWQQSKAALGGDKEALEPGRLVSLIAVLNRLGERAQAEELVAYLSSKDYRHPEFIRARVSPGVSAAEIRTETLKKKEDLNG